MKSPRWLFYWAALLLPLVACEREDPSISLDPGTLEIVAEGGSQTVGLNCNYAWTATASDPWIHVSPASGAKGQATLRISVDANDTGKSRKGSISVTCLELTRSMTISQSPQLLQMLVIRHQGASFQVPSLSGVGLSGMVNWGDGQEEFYNVSLNHSYSSAGDHPITIRANGAVSFDVGSVAGVSEIDFEKF